MNIGSVPLSSFLELLSHKTVVRFYTYRNAPCFKGSVFMAVDMPLGNTLEYMRVIELIYDKVAKDTGIRQIHDNHVGVLLDDGSLIRMADWHIRIGAAESVES